MKVGLDVGGTKVHAVAIGDDNTILAEARLATRTGDDGVVASIRDAIAQVVPEGFVASSIGIGIPGQIVPGTNRVQHAVNLGITDLDLAAALAPYTAAPVRIENDVKAATIGAHALRGGGDALAYLNIGTGVAAGLMLHGKLHRGAQGIAGEIGHMSVDPAGPACRCGQRGCIEALCGGGAVTERWGHSGTLPIRDIFDAADAGNERAAELRSGIAQGIAAAVRVLVLSTDADAVVVGGGVAAVGDRLFDDVRAIFRQAAESSPFLRSLGFDARMETLPAASPAAALGAALVGVAEFSEGALAHG
ncbi:ROK family protein [Microbacterium sp. NC79]|uniref:ROK family protein n=1 Tax=Microbacterium sp. NC79 TaxID=2851009 RepID=UPI001C2C8762|nr:ROK family protein [Microbacterium sp. NC79]MBV0894211.1 ROK family protein [Microbacterium sp. NC79]